MNYKDLGEIEFICLLGVLYLADRAVLKYFRTPYKFRSWPNVSIPVKDAIKKSLQTRKFRDLSFYFWKMMKENSFNIKILFPKKY